MTIKVLEAQLEAAKAAAAIGLLDAVRVIAQSGFMRRPSYEWVKDWNGKRFFYGARNHDDNYPYAEVLVLHYSKTHPVHEMDKEGNPTCFDHRGRPMKNPDDCVTGTEPLYSVENDGKLPSGHTVCFRQGDWVKEVLAEADRIRKLAPAPPIDVDAPTDQFAAYPA